MNIEEFIPVAERVSDRVERAAKVADGKDTINESTSYWDMFQNKDEWFTDAQQRGCLRQKPGNPYWTRPNKDTFHQWVTAVLAERGKPTYALAQTKKRLQVGEVLTHVPGKVRPNFSGIEQALPLHRLIRDGYADKIGEAIDLATADGGQITQKTIRKAATQVKTKYDHQRAVTGKRHNTDAAAERTSQARYRAELAFDKLLTAAAKSANGADEVNAFFDYIEKTVASKPNLKVVV